MSTFTLDTSGRVNITSDPAKGFIRWDDLSPFAQGYVEALFASLRRWNGRPVLPVPGPEGSSSSLIEVAFCDLHPEALAMILRDCEALTQEFPTMALTHNDGFVFWHSRQSGFRPGADAFHGASLKVAFPPLRVSLDDAGKVRLEVAL